MSVTGLTRASDILKMDIEFAEFEVMNSLDRDFPLDKDLELPVGQIMIEIHLFNGLTAGQYLEW